jgi:hypothetical protein
MKVITFFTFILFLGLQSYSQTIKGKIFDSSNGDPLIYASIGVIETPLGTISDEKGNFSLEVNGQDPKIIVRFSMIGYKSQSFSIEQLKDQENEIKLEVETTQLPEVIVKPLGKLKKVGTDSYTKPGPVCGWSGLEFGKGSEHGLKIELGDQAVRLKRISIRVFFLSFDSCLFRLHVRDIVDNLPHNELLNENIMIPIAKNSGWVDIDLNKYNLVFKGDLAVTIEWIKVIGAHEDLIVNMNNRQASSNNVLLNLKMKKGCFYTRKATEDRWKLIDNQSPSIYLTVQ